MNAEKLIRALNNTPHRYFFDILESVGRRFGLGIVEITIYVPEPCDNSETDYQELRLHDTLGADQFAELRELEEAEKECEDRAEVRRIRARMHELYAISDESAYDEMGWIAREAGLIEYEERDFGYAWAGTREQIQAAINNLPEWASGSIIE